MTVYKMNLSTTEPNNSVGIIKARQYDSETQIFEATITENGKPVDLTGLTVLFCVRASPVTGLGLSEQLITDVDVTNSVVRHTLTDYDMQMIGLNKAYFAFRKREDKIERFEHQFSTKDFPYTVMPSIFSDGIKDSNYIWTFEEILRYFQEWVHESMKTYDDWYLVAQAELERIISEFNSWIAANQDIYDEWISGQKTDFMDWLQGNKDDFTDWFESIRDILDENVAGNIQNQLDKINPDTEVIQLIHDLKSYPEIRALYWEYGIGTVPLEYEKTGLGGGNVITVNSAIEYLDRYSMKVKVPRFYKLVNPEKIVLKNAVRLISDHRVLQIEFKEDAEIEIPVLPPKNLAVSDVTKNSAVLAWNGDNGDVVVTKKVKLTLDFKDKVAGSVVENPHFVKSVGWDSLRLPNASSTTLIELSQANYNNIAEQGDSKISTLSNSTNNNMMQLISFFNVIEAFERYDSNYFSDRNATTLNEKVAIAKNEITAITANIWGFGSGPNSTYMAMRHWNGVNWKGSAIVSGTTVKKATETIDNIDETGFVNVLAYAAASDGTTASTLSIDYASLDIEFEVSETINNAYSPYTLRKLDSNADYSVKVINESGESNAVTFKTKEITYKEVTLTLDFKGKVTGNIVENPHKMTRTAYNNLLKPEQITFEFTQDDYEKVKNLDNTVFNLNVKTTSYIVQMMSSYNIIGAIERYDSNYFSDRNAITLAEKVVVARKEISKFTIRSNGFGSGASGNKFTMNIWSGANSTWYGGQFHTDTKVKELQQAIGQANNYLYINTDGFIYALVSAPPSDGTTASSVSIDYASLDITFLVEED